MSKYWQVFQILLPSQNVLNLSRSAFLLVSIFLIHLLDDGKTKPTPKPDERKTKKKGKVTKPSSEPTIDPDFMCLIRANYRAEKISTVVSFEEIIEIVF